VHAVRRLACVLALQALLLVGTAAAGEGDFVEDPSFLRVKIDGRTYRLEALTVKRADAAGRLPVALITHGKAPLESKMLDDHASNFVRQARDLARRGWLAVVVIRRGFGASDGPLAAPASCASTSLIERFAADADDLQASLEAIAQRPDADPARVIAIGVSAGGAAVTALSARNPKGLLGVVNISGGLRFERCPKEEALVAAFRSFAATSRVPSLWIYAKNDSFFGPAVVERMHEAFLDGGGDVKLVMLEPGEGDGHFIFSQARGRLKWLPQMDAFLRYQKLPTWRREDVDALMEKLGVKEAARGLVETYVAGPSERALAQSAADRHVGVAWGWASPEEARKSAISSCERSGGPCEVTMENDRWVAPAR
jgi:dienelactone hydrolase